MGESKPHIICGPTDDYEIPNDSVGRIIFDCLRGRNPGDVLNIDAVTGDVLTCEDLLKQSIQVAAVFEQLGIKKDDVIAIISENTLNYFVSVLAAFYMGSIANPLNPDYKERELRHGLLLSKPKLILSSEKALKLVLQLRQEFNFIEGVVLMGPRSGAFPTIDSLVDLAQAAVVDTLNFKPKQLDPLQQGALILLSSGTTGLSKGVLLTHRNLREVIVSFVHPMYGNVTPQDITVTVLPFFHMFGLTVQLLMMAISLKAVVMDKFNPVLFLESIQNHRVTKLFVVPPILLFFSKSPLVNDYDLSSLKDIIVGGASVSKALQNQVKERLRTITIRQAYGLTETAGACTFQTNNCTKDGSVGTLIPSASAKIWDSTIRQNVDPYKIGEVCIKGPTLMKEYFGNQSATQRCIDEEGFYHTGDLGYWDFDRELYITGRISELIKCNGFKISPIELEAVILTHPLVKECGVVGVPNEKVGEAPFAFIVIQKGAFISEKQIEDFVAERISVQKQLHGGVRFVNEIPKTPSGKIIRRKLLELFESL